MDRTIEHILPSTDVIDDGDMRLRRALPHPALATLGPFVFVDHYRHRTRRGIGDRPHPHAGIEVVSYLLDGTVEHRDSMGHRDRLVAGDAQFIRAGRGMLHAEEPGGGRHGLQLWVNLPPDRKLVDPSYRSLRAADLPETAADDSRLVVVAGRVDALRGPMPLSGDAVFARLRLEPSGERTLSVDADRELGLYVLQGAITVAGRTAATGDLALLAPGDRVRVQAHGGEPAEVALLGGRPVEGDVLFSGPFVMDTPERLAQARRDFASGRMGRLDAVAA